MMMMIIIIKKYNSNNNNNKLVATIGNFACLKSAIRRRSGVFIGNL